MYKHFIWDFDGTLFDTYPLMMELHRQVLLEFGIVEDMERIYKIHNEEGSNQVKKYYTKTYNLSEEDFLKSYTEKEANKECVKYAKLSDGVFEVLNYIQNKGFTNYILTNKNDSIYNFLEPFDMRKYFKDIVLSSHGYAKKPETQMFEYLLSKYELDKREVLYIGDTNTDLIPCGKLGIDVCLYRPVSEKLVYEPKFIIQDMRELYVIIGN